MVRYQQIKPVNAVNEITQPAISFTLFGTLVIFGIPLYDLLQARQLGAPNETLSMGPRVCRDALSATAASRCEAHHVFAVSVTMMELFTLRCAPAGLNTHGPRGWTDLPSQNHHVWWKSATISTMELSESNTKENTIIACRVGPYLVPAVFEEVTREQLGHTATGICYPIQRRSIQPSHVHNLYSELHYWTRCWQKVLRKAHHP